LHFNGSGKNNNSVAILILNKIDFKKKTVTRDKGRALCDDKGINPTRGYNN